MRVFYFRYSLNMKSRLGGGGAKFKNENISTTTVSSVVNKTLKLFPNDIEGAEISVGLLKQKKVSKEKLIRWLKCRKGAKWFKNSAIEKISNINNEICVSM